jgi:hypothetical protein
MVRCIIEKTGAERFIPENLIKDKSFMKRNGLVVQDLKVEEKKISEKKVEAKEELSPAPKKWGKSKPADDGITEEK